MTAGTIAHIEGLAAAAMPWLVCAVGALLVSYNCVISGNVAHVTSTLNLVTRNRSVNEEFDMDIVQTNGVWKINQW